MEINQACRMCTKLATKSCGSCFNAYYCSRACQILDWNLHKAFCRKGEDQKLAQSRRESCLRKINEDAVYNFLICFNYLISAGEVPFLLISEKSIRFLILEDYSEMEKWDIGCSKSVYKELRSEVVRSGIFKRSIVVYDHTQVEPAIYVVRANNMEDVKKIVDAMLPGLLDIVFQEYVKLFALQKKLI